MSCSRSWLCELSLAKTSAAPICRVIDLSPRGSGAQLQVHFVDRNGAPVDGLSIEGNLRRPATTREDRPVVLTALGNGVYTADVGKIAAGVWVLHGSATRGAERFTFERRMTWTPAL
jgi:nitrogen fixation protein FixH